MSVDTLARMIRAHSGRTTWLAEDEAVYVLGVMTLEAESRERRGRVYFTGRALAALSANGCSGTEGTP